MKRILFFASLAAMLSCGSILSVYAQKGKGAAAQAFDITKATTRHIASGGHGHAETKTEISIAWKSAVSPKAIYYRPDAAHWLKCKATRSERRSFGGGPNDYMIAELNTPIQRIKQGDNINLQPEEFPSDVQPTAVKSMPAGAIFYQLSDSDTWHAVKVKPTKLPDLK